MRRYDRCLKILKYISKVRWTHFFISAFTQHRAWPTLSRAINSHSLLCRHRLPRAWQVDCHKRRKSIKQIIKCCMGQSEMSNPQAICEFLIQNPLPEIPYTWPLAHTHARRWALFRCLRLLFDIVKATGDGAMRTVPTHNRSWASVFLPAESREMRFRENHKTSFHWNTFQWKNNR